MSYEWWYWWGRDHVGKFYHYATFKKDDLEFGHHSYDGKFYEREPVTVYHSILPKDKEITHNTKTCVYHSWPGDPWFDHTMGDSVGCNWDWVSILLDCGMSIMAWDKGDEEHICDFTIGKTTVESDFILENRHFYIYQLGAYLTLTPLKEEKIFRPKYGRPYSETPILVEAKGRQIGYGMRERTYKEV